MRRVETYNAADALPEVPKGENQLVTHGHATSHAVVQKFDHDVVRNAGNNLA